MRHALSVAAALALTISSSSASTVTLVSDATSIVVGESITFNLLITNVVHPTAFVGSNAIFQSGDGQAQVAGIGSLSGGENVTFTYLIPGVYFPFASGELLFDIWACNFNGPGCGPVPLTAGDGEDTGAFGAAERITVSVSVPEPATWLLLLIGFALLGRAGRSWKPRPALAARDCSHL